MQHRQTALLSHKEAYLCYHDLPSKRSFYGDPFKMLGHKHITTTQIYAKITHPMIAREVDMLKEKLVGKFSDV